MNKLDKLLEIEGLDFDGLMRIAGYDSVCPGICTNKGCDYTTIVEPDCTAGYCEICNTSTVQSGAILAGVI